jgi:hypothetical protein
MEVELNLSLALDKQKKPEDLQIASKEALQPLANADTPGFYQ